MRQPDWKSHWLPYALAAAQIAAFAVAAALSSPGGDAAPEASQNQLIWAPLLIAQAACASLIWGLGAGGAIKRFLQFLLAMAIVAACFVASQHVAGDGGLNEGWPWIAVQLQGFLVVFALPYLCVGGVLLILRSIVGPVTAQREVNVESPRRIAAEFLFTALLATAGVVWRRRLAEQGAIGDVDAAGLTVNMVYVTSQLLGAAAFAFACGGFWRIVGFTYVVCVAMQGFMNQPNRDLSAFWLAAGPWIVVLATTLAMRRGGCQFAASRKHAACAEEGGAAPTTGDSTTEDALVADKASS